jgi:hypothetical protein
MMPLMREMGHDVRYCDNAAGGDGGADDNRQYALDAGPGVQLGRT